MLAVEAKKRERSVSDLSREFGWSKQSFYTWIQGSIPRDQWHRKIAEFLKINLEDVEMLVEEARTSTGNTKIPKMQPAVFGKVVDRKDGKFHFDLVDGQRTPRVRYAFRVDTKILEPALIVGGLAWAEPGVWPKPGNEVLVHAKGGSAWLGHFVSVAEGIAVIDRPTGQREVKDVEDIHVIVLSERVPS
jgi:hypothetical protein